VVQGTCFYYAVECARKVSFSFCWAFILMATAKSRQVKFIASIAE